MRGQGDIIGSVRAQILSQAPQDTTVCIDRDQIVSTRYPGPNSWAIKVPLTLQFVFFLIDFHICVELIFEKIF